MNGKWIQQAELLSPTGANSGLFGGLGIGISGNTIMAGDGGNRFNPPAIDVFTLTGGGWQQTATLTVPDDDAFLPVSIGIDRNTAVTGSFLGTAYVFALSNGQWVQRAKLTAPDDNFLTTFGFSVGISEDLIVVGANFGTGATPTAGAVYVFAREEGAWNLQAKLFAADGADFDEFGFSTAVDGGTVLVGAFDHVPAVGPAGGSVYVFQRRDGEWSQAAELQASDGIDGGGFGSGVAIQNSTLLIGASGQHPPVEGYAGGEAYVDKLPGGRD